MTPVPRWRGLNALRSTGDSPATLRCTNNEGRPATRASGTESDQGCLTTQTLAWHTSAMPHIWDKNRLHPGESGYEPAYRRRGETRRWVDKDSHGWEIRFSVDLVDGRLSLTDLSITPTEPGYALTQSVLRQLPIAQWERETFADESTRLVTLASEVPSAPHAGRRHSDDELRHVAAVYLTALNARLPVQQTVAEVLGLPLSTATKRIVAARKKGYIPPATRKETTDE